MLLINHCEMYLALNSGSANYGLWAKCGLPSVFVNKVLLEHGHVHYTYYLCKIVCISSMAAFMPQWQN